MHPLSKFRILMPCEVDYFCQPKPIISAKNLALTLLSSIKVTIFLACQREFLKDVFKVFFFWLSTRSLKAVIILLSACPYLITVIEAKLSAAVSTECTMNVFVNSTLLLCIVGLHCK